MRISGHVTTSMFLRYGIATDIDTANALKTADAYLSPQPRALGHNPGSNSE
jgi:hypothetical protein